jgi:hypothetical protein
VRIVGIPLLGDPKIVALINAHSNHFSHDSLVVDPDDGYFSDENIKASPHVFFQYLTFLFKVLEQILLKAPFQLVPQFTMKRRSITLGVEQVAELMQRLSKTEGLLEELGIDFGAIPSPEEVFSTNFVNRVQRQQVKTASHGLKRQRVEAGVRSGADEHLSPRSKKTTYGKLSPKGTGAITSKFKAVGESGSCHTKNKTTTTEDVWTSVEGTMEKVPSDGCLPSILSTTRCTEALERSHHH